MRVQKGELFSAHHPVYMTLNRALHGEKRLVAVSSSFMTYIVEGKPGLYLSCKEEIKGRGEVCSQTARRWLNIEY